MQSLQKHSAHHIVRVPCEGVISLVPAHLLAVGCVYCGLWTLLFVPMVLSHLLEANSKNLISVKEFIGIHSVIRGGRVWLSMAGRQFPAVGWTVFPWNLELSSQRPRLHTCLCHKAP